MLKLGVLAAAVAAAAGQAAVMQNDGNDNLLTQPAPTKNVETNLGMNGRYVINNVSTDTMDYTAFSTMARSTLSSMTAQLNAATAQIAALETQLSQTIASNTGAQATLMTEVRNDVSEARAAIDATVSYTTAQTATVDTAVSNAMNTQTQLSMAAAVLEANLLSAYAQTGTVTGAAYSQVASQFTSGGSTMDAMYETTETRLSSTMAAQVAVGSSTVAAAVAPASALLTALGSTHYMHPETPVYRWMMFHVYSNNGVGWFDGNNVRYFGGRNPSRWGDGNTVVWDMHQDFSQLAKFLTRRGVGTVGGATVCSETWYLYSSTDTKYCIAAFRVRNTQPSADIRWRVNWYGTGWSGWGNQQSMTMNRAQNWAGSCTWWCHRAYTFTVPRNRVSTFIFANGMTHPNHYADNHHIETTFLGFDGLQLPAGLQYVDDLDTATGRWR